MTSQLRVVTPPQQASVFRRAYAALAATRLAKVISRHINWKLDPWLLRVSGGRFATTLMFRAAVLETRGARSGLVRRNAIIYFHDEARVTVFGSNAGSAHNPSWVHNLIANPFVTFGGIAMKAHVVTDECEQERLHQQGDLVFPAFKTYRRQAAAAGREVPIIQLATVD